jgi:hypothetical protein
MAGEKKPNGAAETVEVPVALLHQLQARLEQLETAGRLAEEARLHPTKIIDAAWQREIAELGRPPKDRTQDLADARYGKDGKRFVVRLDPTTEDGKKGPNIGEHFPLVISANSDLEAQARYLDIMGIKKHDYRLVATAA